MTADEISLVRQNLCPPPAATRKAIIYFFLFYPSLFYRSHFEIYPFEFQFQLVLSGIGIFILLDIFVSQYRNSGVIVV